MLHIFFYCVVTLVDLRYYLCAKQGLAGTKICYLDIYV